MKAMILAAGLGTRIQPLTQGLPKALAKIENYALLELVIRKLIYFGYRQIIVNVHHQAEMIVDFLQQNKNFGIDIVISDESGQLLNTGGGIWNASWFFDDPAPFLIHNTDVLSTINLTDLRDYHIKHEALATLSIRPREASRYLWFDNTMKLCGWENPKNGETKGYANNSEASRYGFSSIYMLNPSIFDIYKREGSFSIIDVLLDVSIKNKVIGYNDSAALWYDVGTAEKLHAAAQHIKQFKYE